jgi:hypothetical protein
MTPTGSRTHLDLAAARRALAELRELEREAEEREREGVLTPHALWAQDAARRGRSSARRCVRRSSAIARSWRRRCAG